MFIKVALLISAVAADPTFGFGTIACTDDCCTGISECAAPASFDEFTACSSKLPAGCKASLKVTINLPQEDVCADNTAGSVGFNFKSAGYEYQPNQQFKILKTTPGQDTTCQYTLDVGTGFTTFSTCAKPTTIAKTYDANGIKSGSDTSVTVITTGDKIPATPDTTNYWVFTPKGSECKLTADATRTLAAEMVLEATGAEPTPDGAKALFMLAPAAALASFGVLY